MLVFAVVGRKVEGGEPRNWTEPPPFINPNIEEINAPRLCTMRQRHQTRTLKRRRWKEERVDAFTPEGVADVEAIQRPFEEVMAAWTWLSS